MLQLKLLTVAQLALLTTKHALLTMMLLTVMTMQRNAIRYADNTNDSALHNAGYAVHIVHYPISAIWLHRCHCRFCLVSTVMLHS